MQTEPQAQPYKTYSNIIRVQPYKTYFQLNNS